MHLLFHELGGHFLFTYLYRGRPHTPPGVIPKSWRGQPGPAAQGSGESGRYLEDALFGGSLEFFDTPRVSDVIN
jgi:hypothetical protein